MKNNLWIFIAIIAGFMGFLLGYSTPPMMEVGLRQSPLEVETEDQMESGEDEDLAEYYRELQELGD